MNRYIDMMKSMNRKEHGFTLIEVLTVAVIMGVLLALSIPQLIKARISANESNARKALQTLRVAEVEYFHQDLDTDGILSYTNRIGSLGEAGTLRDPSGSGNESDSLIDSSFKNAVVVDGSPSNKAACSDDKAGYCISWSEDVPTDLTVLKIDFGWEASMTSVRKTGRRDFAVYGDAVIRCSLSSLITNSPGNFSATKASNVCD